MPHVVAQTPLAVTAFFKHRIASGRIGASPFKRCEDL